MTIDDFLKVLNFWTERKWIRHIDQAFVQFLNSLVPEEKSLVLMGACLTSHQLGRGHSCLDIQHVLTDPDRILSIPPEENTGYDIPYRHRPSEILKNVTKQTWEQELSNSSLVGTDKETTPLVLDNSLLYLRRYRRYTVKVAQNIIKRVKSVEKPEKEWAEKKCLAYKIDNIFDQSRDQDEKTKKTVHWQSIAAAVASISKFSVISGGPGTGKTTAVIQILGLFLNLAAEKGETLKISLAAPTGKAASRLKESISEALNKLPEDLRRQIPNEATTIHRLLGVRQNSRHFIHNAKNHLPVDLIIIDEASMIDLEMMDALIEALSPSTKLILIGDKDQLSSVEAGSVFADICANADKPLYRTETLDWIKIATGYDLSKFKGQGSNLDQKITVLKKNHRFGSQNGIMAIAKAVNKGNINQVNHILNKGYADISRLNIQSLDSSEFKNLVIDGNSKIFKKQNIPEMIKIPIGYRTFLETIAKGHDKGSSEDQWLKRIISDFNKFRILTPLRQGQFGVTGLKRTCEEILYEAGLIPAMDGWYPGRPVMMTKNDYDLKLMNGDTGIVIETKNTTEKGIKRLTAVFPMLDGSLKRVSLSRIEEVITVYAMTVHKAQGSEFEHTALVFPDKSTPLINRELVYTAITRARSFLTLVETTADILPEAVNRRNYRASGLKQFLFKK